MKNLYTFLFALFLSFFSFSSSAQFVERQQLIGTGGVAAQLQGQSVAISKDGRTAVVGGHSDDSGRGAVWVYTRSGSTWIQQGQKLVPNDLVWTSIKFALFGYSVDLSADGNTLLAGAPNDDSERGAAWIFTRSGNTWVQQGPKLVGTGLGTGMSRFGYSVSLSDDGNTALIGGYVNNGAVGSSFIFTRSGSTWTQQGPKIVPPANTHIEFGRAVSLSADGNTALIGGPAYRGTGASFIFRRNGNIWSLESVLWDSVTGFNGQGIQVKLSADGNTAVVASNPIAGAVTIYKYNGVIWNEEARILVQGAIGASFAGRAIGLSRGGDTLALGGYGDNNDKGAVWLYTRSNGTWSQLGSKIVPANPGRPDAEFGTSVALSGNGKIMLVGAPYDVAPTGKVYFYADSTFSLLSPAVSISSTDTSICSGTAVTFTATPVDGGTTPAYQWKKNGSNVGSNSATYTDNAIANGDVVTVEMTSSATGANPNPVTAPAITMSVTPAVVPTVSIASSAGTNISSGQSVTFTATATHAGTAPVYRWLKNGATIPGETSATYTTSTLANNDTISAILFSSATCATPDSVASNKIGMRVVTGVANALSALNIKLYPNPVQQELTIATAALTAPLTITLTDATGRTMLQQVLTSGTRHSLDLAALPAGIYIVSVQSKKQVQHYRVVKQ